MNRQQIKWAGIAIVTILAYGTFGVALLTAQRQQVAGPLVASSEDIAAQLESGANLNVVAQGSIDMNRSLSPFTIIYTKNGTPVAGSGRLFDSRPAIVMGVLTSSQGKEYSLVTWQPQGSLRYETATVATQNYYVVTAQSLRFTDRSSTMTREITGLGCTLSLTVIYMLYLMHKPAKAAKG